jgi:hypothetical protein
MAYLLPFRRNEVLHNCMKLYPKTEFFIYDSRVFLNNQGAITGSHTSNVGGVSTGRMSLYQENVDRAPSQYIYPFIVKGSDLVAFKTVSEDSFHTDFGYGDIITGSYPLSVGLEREYHAANDSRSRIDALQNPLNANTTLSPSFAYGNKGTEALNLLSVSALFYGSQIRPGSVDLRFYVSGSMIGQLTDYRKNGELVQYGPRGSNGSGSVAGVVLYREGCFVITGAWDISAGTHTEPYIPGGGATTPKWLHFASTGSTGALENLPSSSFGMTFEGINYVNTLTMFCHARMGDLNWSNNPTFIECGQVTTPFSGSKEYREPKKTSIKNITKTAWEGNPTGSFQKITYISRISLYDDQGNVIGFAKMATPVKKLEERAYSFKLRYDIF